MREGRKSMLVKVLLRPIKSWRHYAHIRVRLGEIRGSGSGIAAVDGTDIAGGPFGQIRSRV